LAAGRYTQAESLLKSIPQDAQSEVLLKKCYYLCAEAYATDGQINKALPLYRAAEDYGDAAEKLLINGYEQALMYDADGDYLEASEQYAALGAYRDASDRYLNSRYQYALERYEYGHYEDAMRSFYALGSYEEADDYARLSAMSLTGTADASALVGILTGLTTEQLAFRSELAELRNVLPQGRIAAGYAHTVAVRNDGTVLSTGSNTDGQCNVSAWTNIVMVAAGAYHTVGLKSDGTVVATGNNEYGQCEVANWTEVACINAGGYNTVALNERGDLLQTGFQTYATQSWQDITTLSAGSFALMGVMQNGQAVSTRGELITEAYFDLVSISAATACSAGLKADGTIVSTFLDLSAWNNKIAVVCTSTAILALDRDGHVSARFFRADDAVSFSDWHNVTAIAASATHYVGLTQDGRVQSAGRNDAGQCDTTTWDLLE
ncbi:MAG: hypothetical protein RR297_04025, partial [Clostridia bacterium]